MGWQNSPNCMQQTNSELQRRRSKNVTLASKRNCFKAKWPVYFTDRGTAWFYGFLPITNNKIWQANIEISHIKKEEVQCQIVHDIWMAWSKTYFKVPDKPRQF